MWTPNRSVVCIWSRFHFAADRLYDTTEHVTFPMIVAAASNTVDASVLDTLYSFYFFPQNDTTICIVPSIHCIIPIRVCSRQDLSFVVYNIHSMLCSEGRFVCTSCHLLADHVCLFLLILLFVVVSAL